jgi:hypothetical protein
MIVYDFSEDSLISMAAENLSFGLLSAFITLNDGMKLRAYIDKYKGSVDIALMS